MADAFDAELFGRLAAELTLGRPLTHSESTASTNDDALAAARNGAAHGALFVTEAQRAGRGRRGNAWLAAPRQGLLFSVVLRPNVAPEQAPALALLAGLAVREAVARALEESHIHARALVKWPNDVVVADKKIAGILTESQVRGAEVGAVVVGVGLNVGQLHLPEDVQRHATSLERLGLTTGREAMLAAILQALEARLALLKNREVPLKNLVLELNAEDALRNRKLAVDGLSGVGAGIDETGRLRLVDAAGVAHLLRTGHVSFWDARDGARDGARDDAGAATAERQTAERQTRD